MPAQSSNIRNSSNIRVPSSFSNPQYPAVGRGRGAANAAYNTLTGQSFTNNIPSASQTSSISSTSAYPTTTASTYTAANTSNYTTSTMSYTANTGSYTSNNTNAYTESTNTNYPSTSTTGGMIYANDPNYGAQATHQNTNYNTNHTNMEAAPGPASAQSYPITTMANPAALPADPLSTEQNLSSYTSSIGAQHEFHRNDSDNNSANNSDYSSNIQSADQQQSNIPQFQVVQTQPPELSQSVTVSQLQHSSDMSQFQVDQPQLPELPQSVQNSISISHTTTVTQSPTSQSSNINQFPSVSESATEHQASTASANPVSSPSQALAVSQSSEVSDTSADAQSLSKSLQAIEAADKGDTPKDTEVNIPFLDSPYSSSSSSGPPSPKDKDPDYNPRKSKI